MSDFVSPPPPPPQAPPPPPAMPGAVAVKPGPIGWVAVAAGVLGLLSFVLPWYSPKLSKAVDGRTSLNADYHAWNGFFLILGVGGPLLLVLFAVLWFQALRGQVNSRFAGSANPTRSLSLQSVGAGAVALVLGLLSFVLMSHHYKNWDEISRSAKNFGVTVQKNPQPGLYALLLGAVLLIVAGAAALVMPGSAAAPTATPGAMPTAGQPVQEGYGAAPGYYPPVNPPQS